MNYPYKDAFQMNMRRLASNLVLLVFIVFTAVMSYAAGWREDVIGKLGGERSWTVMLYLDGDERAMEEDYIAAFRDMVEAKVGSSEDVNIVVQFDRLPENNTDYGNWSITHRFYVTPGMEPTEENAIADWGDGKGGREVDMADPDTLLNFVNWATSHYPAENYALVIADHGYGWKGMAVDTTSRGDFLKVKELRDALASVTVDIDLLALDACLMQMVEVAYELRDTGVHVVVGSELPGSTWPYADIVSELTNNPLISPQELGARINDLYFEAHADATGIALSTLDITKIEALSQAIRDFASVSIDGLPDDIVKKKAEAILENINQVVLYSRNSADWEGYINGLSIFFPLEDPWGNKKEIRGVGMDTPPEFFYFYTQQITSFSEEKLWRDLLFLFYNLDERLSDAFIRTRTEFDKTKVIDGENVDIHDFFSRVVEKL